MIPPQSIEAEQAVLGTILLQDKALLKIVEMLAADDFYRDAHKTIYAAMLTLFEKRGPNDLITITSLIKIRFWEKTNFSKRNRGLCQWH